MVLLYVNTNLAYVVECKALIVLLSMHISLTHMTDNIAPVFDLTHLYCQMPSQAVPTHTALLFCIQGIYSKHRRTYICLMSAQGGP